MSEQFYHEELYENSEEDVMTLQYTLRQCRKQLLLTIENLIDTEFSYSKIELREDFNQLQRSYEDLKEETNSLKIEFHALIEDCQVLIQQTTEMLSERDSYYSEWQYAKNILTPRPDWDKCADLIPDWRKLAQGKSSEELVDLVIKEIVPKEDLAMRRRMTGLLIKEIWSKKLFEVKIKLTDYVFDYLTKRFDSRDMAVEMSDNIRNACQRYRHHYEMNLFWQILTGQMEENVYHDEMKEFARILQYLIKLCPNSSTESLLWTISWSELSDALHELYPNWINERIVRVMMAARREFQHSSNEKNELEFLLLFMEDDEGHIGEFLRSIREERQIDKNEYIEKIRNMLMGHPLISIKQFKRVVQIVDPWISKKELRRYVKWVFESKQSSGELQPNRRSQMRDFDEIIYRLECCSCFMH